MIVELITNVFFHSRRELQEGVPVVDDNGNKLGQSKIAAKTGIIAVVLSRVGMASPGMGKLSFPYLMIIIKKCS
jgi:hypothetical protein